jgi:hypothetical protein
MQKVQRNVSTNNANRKKNAFAIRFLKSLSSIFCPAGPLEIGNERVKEEAV